MLEFRDEYIINSPKANFCVRWNEGDYSPYEKCKWELDAKCVIETKPVISQIAITDSRGVYAYSDELFAYGIEPENKDKIILLLDYDADDLLFGKKDRKLIEEKYSFFEICLRKANIVKIFTAEEFNDSIFSGKLEDIKKDWARQKEILYSTCINRNFVFPKVSYAEGITNEQVLLYLHEVHKLKAFYSQKHGIKHWINVAVWGNFIARHYKSNVDIEVVTWFALFHDTQRLTDGQEFDHGARAAFYVDTLRESLLAPLTKEQIQKLKYACLIHTKARRLNDPTLQVCCDADRLDLMRFGIKPNPDLLFTVSAKLIAKMVNQSKLLKENYDAISAIRAMRANPGITSI